MLLNTAQLCYKLNRISCFFITFQKNLHACLLILRLEMRNPLNTQFDVSNLDGNKSMGPVSYFKSKKFMNGIPLSYKGIQISTAHSAIVPKGWSWVCHTNRTLLTEARPIHRDRSTPLNNKDLAGPAT